MTQPHSRIYRQSSALIMAFFVGAISLSQKMQWTLLLISYVIMMLGPKPSA